MNRQCGQTSVEERNLMIFHYNKGKTLREIGNIINRSHSTEQCVINRFKSGSEVKNKTKAGPRKIFNQHDERWLLRKVKEDPKISAPKLALEAEKYLKKKTCLETIRNVLKKKCFHGRIASKKPFTN